jgi:hypothetical protein
MSWISILEKNNTPFQKSLKKEIIEENNEKKIINEIKNPDDEFEILYTSIISDIKIDFENYIKNNNLPFLNNNNLNKLNNKNNYDFYDFIKYNSINYEKIVENINNENLVIIDKIDDSDEDYNDIIE